MAGGLVIETIDVPSAGKLPARVWINTREDRHDGEVCAIYVEQTAAARCVQPDDSVYWDMEWARWSPKSRAFRDFHLKRVGTSGARRPKMASSNEAISEVSPQINRLSSGASSGV